jgi:hypothetical protein
MSQVFQRTMIAARICHGTVRLSMCLLWFISAYLHMDAAALGASGWRIYQPAELPQGIAHAEFALAWPLAAVPRAVVVLVPGFNEDGAASYLSEDGQWRKFAEKRNVALLAVSFRSKESKLSAGLDYYYPEKGSGRLLLDALATFKRDISAMAGVPVLLFGFSGGAHFVHRFAQWRPSEVAGFCAYSAGWWMEPNVEVARVPALIMCGFQDVRFDATLDYFRAGRELGAPWCFVRVRRTGHSVASSAVEFAQSLMTARLEAAASRERWWMGHLYDLAIGPAADGRWVLERDASLVVFPTEACAREWRNFNIKQAGP